MPSRTRLPGLIAPVLSGLVLLTAATAPAFADKTGNFYDPVTGYRCVDHFCRTIKLEGTNCLCVKQNPVEQNPYRVIFKCYGFDHGWKACPVAPDIGSTIDWQRR